MRVEMSAEDAGFTIDSLTRVYIDAPDRDAALLEEQLAAAGMGHALRVCDSVDAPRINFRLKPVVDGISSHEGYRLSVSGDRIDAEALSPAGLYYALQTILDLKESGGTIPAMSITDQPRLPYRGMMLDVSRHFRDKEFVKKQMDAMARLKLNRLHLHLTDAAGWRIEIKKYPKLTELAAWRPQKTWKEWTDNGARYCNEGDTAACGGYFTQDDIRELLDYAAKRHITIIPEIEMPSHSEEVLAAYPELSCSHGEHGSSDFCVGNEATFEFVEGVLDEVMELFPSQVIHIGGDEASKQAWKTCELCQKRMADEGLMNVDELQSYMIHRVEKYLNAHGRDLLGWDEIMEGGLAPNAAVMSWRGTEGGLRAARDGHRVIMTPGGYCYLDSYQDAPWSQPEAFGGYLPIEKVYSFDPVPDSLPEDAKPLIIGLQGNLWCEYIPTAEHAEYMLWPRMIAIAEAAWSPQQRRDCDGFKGRAMAVSDRMRKAGYTPFDMRNEVGNRKEALVEADHLARGCKVTYLLPDSGLPAWHNGYPASKEATLTDGKRGGWNYNDMLWQGYMNTGTRERLDVVIDLGRVCDLSSISADFMQICIPDVWMPEQVTISVSDDNKKFKTLADIHHTVTTDTGVSFKNFGWKGSARGRYIRYRAMAKQGFLFTDEIVVE